MRELLLENSRRNSGPVWGHLQTRSPQSYTYVLIPGSDVWTHFHCVIILFTELPEIPKFFLTTGILPLSSKILFLCTASWLLACYWRLIVLMDTDFLASLYPQLRWVIFHIDPGPNLEMCLINETVAIYWKKAQKSVYALLLSLLDPCTMKRMHLN